MNTIEEMRTALDLLVRKKGRLQRNKAVLAEAIHELSLYRDAHGRVCPQCGNEGETRLCSDCGVVRVSRAVVALRERDERISRQEAVIREFSKNS